MPDTRRPNDDTRSAHRHPPVLWVGAAILALLLGWALKASAVVTVPIVSAILLAIVLSPLDRAIAARLRRGLSWLGRAAVMTILLVALAVFFAGLLYSARQVIEEMPRITSAVEEMLPRGMPTMEEVVGPGQGEGDIDPAGIQPPPDEGGDLTGGVVPGNLREVINQAGSAAAAWLVDASTGLARRIAGAVGTFIGATIIVVFLVLLALGEGPLWRHKLGRLWPDGSASWQHALETVSRKLRSFILVRAAMGAVSAALYVAWLWLFDVGLLPVWAVLTFLLGFIPNLGSVISSILPALYALVTTDLQTTLVIALGLFAIEQVIGNFLDPRMQGRQVSVSPVVVLVAILVWGWIWGVAGALLAVPVTIALLVGFAHVPALRPVALLLSNQPTQERLMQSMEW